MALNAIERIGQLFYDPGKAWDTFKNGETNTVNQEIANQNLEYQKQRNKIEDERYAEESAYNRAFAEDERAYQRAFAEDERAYNRALQQELFNREDTAITRQAQQLSSLGINPASQQLNGLDAGAALTPSSAGSSVEPTQSSRGGSALHNDFRMSDIGVGQALAPLASLAQSINAVKTGETQRDLLQSQVDKQTLDNYITAVKHGLSPTFMKKFNDFNTGSTPLWYNMVGNDAFNKLRLDKQTWYINDLDKQIKQREFDFQKKSGFYNSAPDWVNTLQYLSSDSFSELGEKVLTKGVNLFDRAFTKESDKKSFANSPLFKFFSLFF